MARPAIVIGVGGAGQWVLTFLKKDLVETGNGKVPKEVKLLSFDTLKHSSAVAGHDADMSPKTQEKRQKKAGAVELTDKIEYIHVGADLNPLVKQIKDGQMPHLDWLKADTAIATLPEASLKCDDGAGAIRHLGRLCLINDVQTRATSKIASNISAAMTDIGKLTTVSVQNRLEVIIVGSLAGGTGSGMLVDMALLCRKLAPTAFAGNITVRGFIITPRAFTQGGIGDQSQNMLAYSFAAWRELDRFMITSSEYGGNRVQYAAADPDLTLSTERRLFDVTYIVDPMRPESPLQPGEPEKGLYPAVANAISAMLDDVAGKKYSEQVINLSNTFISQPRKPLHSAIGTYTMKVPIYYEQMKFTYELASEALKKLLEPVEEEGKVTRLMDNHNQEVEASKVGLNSALDFLAADSGTANGAVLPNTLLGKRVSDIRKNNRRDDDRYKKQVASGNLTDERNAMTGIQQDAKGNTILQGFNKEYGFHIWQDVSHSMDIGKNPNSKDEQNRIQKGITDSRTNHLGAPGAIGGSRGRLGEELEKAKWAQVRLFGAYLAAFTEQTLNGNSTNPEVARGGKLGYLLAFYKNLIETLGYYIGFLEDVSKERAEGLHKEANARKRSTHAWDAFLKNPKKSCWVTFWDQNIHPLSHELLREYLRAEDRVNDVLKENILIEFSSQTATEWKKIAEAAFTDLKRWETFLAKGMVINTPDPKNPTHLLTTEVKGLYSAVKEELDNVNVNHKLDKQLQGVSEVVGETKYESSSQDVQALLAKLYWHVAPIYQDVHLADNSTFQKVVGVDCSFTALNDGKTLKFLKDGETAKDTNLDILQQIAGEPFAVMIQTNPPKPFAVAVMQDTDTNTGAKLAEHLHNKAEPFFMKVNGGIGPIHKPHPRTALIRVQGNVNADTTQYFTDPENGFRAKLAALDKTVFLEDLADSGDDFKLTYVRFDDCIVSQDFDIWKRCRDAYLGFVNNPLSSLKPEDFHVFPAEIHACRYERKIMEELQRSYRILDPAIVALLDNDQRVEMFFRAKALDMIKRKKDVITNNTYWIFQQPGGQEIQLTIPSDEMGRVNEEDYFFLVNQFCVKACDIRSDRQGNYKFIVNWDTLRTAIFDQVNKMTRAKMVSTYEKQISGPEGIVKELRDYVAAKRQEVASPLEKERTAVAHEDLANLAETIYRIAMKANV